MLLGAGMVWSAAHLFGSGVFSVETLAYGGFFLTIPHMFFSIRAWISKKGWFTILFHSAWNVTVLVFYCMMEWRQCSVINDMFDVLNLIMAGAAGIIVYLAHQNKKKPVNRFWYLVPVAVIFVAIIFLFSNDVVF